MTATTIAQGEAAPASYPDAPGGLSTDAAALDPAMIWQRIEAYVAWRWSARTVEWVVDGCGEWVPPLKPATIATTEAWDGTAWVTATLSASPLGGYMLPGDGPYRFTGTVGGGAAEVPAAVTEAFRRLAEYMSEKPGKGGARVESESVPDVATESVERSAAWMAQALVNSGAADLLRPYRRA
jgi:hypothetical protein